MEDAWAGTLHRVRVRWGGVVPGRLRQLLPRTVCLAGLMALAGMAYAFHYPHAVKSTQALALLQRQGMTRLSEFGAEGITATFCRESR